MKYLVILIIIASTLQGCISDDDCQEIGRINFSNNEYPAIFTVTNENLKVNDSFTVLVKTPMQMTDITGEEQSILNSPDIWIRFTDQTNVEPLDTVNVFNVGAETLHAMFEEYFDQNIIVGESDIIFRHKASLVEDEYILEIEYKIKQPGVFLIDVRYDENRIMIENDLDSKCINFVQPKIYWQTNPINKVLDYYSSDYDQSNKFVIEVEE